MQDNITVVGTVASAPERRRTTNGTTVAHFRLASTRRRRDQNTGEWRDEGTNWYSVTAYRTLAEHALASIEKGHRVIVTGAFRLREWDTGEKRGKSAEIDADALGHDLLWGTTTYARAQPGTAPAPASVAPPVDEWASTAPGSAAGDWGAPSSAGGDWGAPASTPGIGAAPPIVSDVRPVGYPAPADTPATGPVADMAEEGASDALEYAGATPF